MQRRILSVALMLCGVAAITGCGSGFLGSWGDLGDEVSAGPYVFQLPKGFKQDKQSVTMPGETKVMFRGPAFGKSEPGIVFSYGPHHQDFTREEPHWAEAVRMGLSGLRMKCTGFSHTTGSPTSINGLPGVRIEFSGSLSHKGETRPMQGVGYLLIDNTNLLFALGMDFGPGAASSIPKFEKSLLTIKRPGFSMPVNSWKNGGSSPSDSGALAGNYPGGSSMGSSMGSSFAEDSSAGGAYPGSTSTGSSYPGGSARPGGGARPGGMGSRFGPGAGRPGGMSGGGYPGMGSGMSGPRGGYPGSSFPGSSFPGSGPGSGPGRGPGSGMSSGRMGASSASGSSGSVDPEEARRRAEEAERRAAEAKRASELAITAANPGDPKFYSANLELLRIGNDSQKDAVLQRLSDTRPSDIHDSELRKELARGLRNVAEDAQVGLSTRRAAIPVLVEWTSSYSVPILNGLLQDKQRLIQMDALEYLASFQDDRSIEPVTELFVNNPVLRDKAADCLRGFGTAAEDKVLELSRPTDLLLTRATVQLLGEIGTDKSLRPIGQLRKLGFYSMLKKDINEAVAKIRERSDAEK